VDKISTNCNEEVESRRKTDDIRAKKSRGWKLEEPELISRK
jgi:hypothetical protein